MILLLTIDLHTNILLACTFLWAIEIVSNSFRTVSLGFRLFANIFSGHLILVMFLAILVNFLYLSSLAASTIIGLLLLILMAMELFMAVVQAYVFSTLAKIYLQELL